MLNLKPDDLLAKYLFHKKEIRADGTPRPRILTPRRGEMLSMMEISTLEHKNVCEHGREYVDNPEKNRLNIGYLKFVNRSLVDLGLKTIYDNHPPRHVSVQFPEEEEKRRELAKALCAKTMIVDSNATRKYFADCPDLSHRT